MSRKLNKRTQRKNITQRSTESSDVLLVPITSSNSKKFQTSLYNGLRDYSDSHVEFSYDPKQDMTKISCVSNLNEKIVSNYSMIPEEDRKRLNAKYFVMVLSARDENRALPIEKIATLPDYSNYINNRFALRTIPMKNGKFNVIVEEAAEVLKLALSKSPTNFSNEKCELAAQDLPIAPIYKGYYQTMTIESFVDILIKYKLDLNLFTFVPDVVFAQTTMAAIHEPIAPIGMFNGDGELIMTGSQALLYLFQSVVCGINWSDVDDKEEMDKVTKVNQDIFVFLAMYWKLEESQLISKKEVDRAIETLQLFTSFLSPIVQPVPNYAHEELKHTDIVPFPLFMKTWRNLGFEEDEYTGPIKSPFVHQARIWYIYGAIRKYFPSHYSFVAMKLLDALACKIPKNFGLKIIKKFKNELLHTFQMEERLDEQEKERKAMESEIKSGMPVLNQKDSEPVEASAHQEKKRYAPKSAKVPPELAQNVFETGEASASSLVPNQQAECHESSQKPPSQPQVDQKMSGSVTTPMKPQEAAWNQKAQSKGFMQELPIKSTTDQRKSDTPSESTSVQTPSELILLDPKAPEASSLPIVNQPGPSQYNTQEQILNQKMQEVSNIMENLKTATECLGTAANFFYQIPTQVLSAETPSTPNPFLPSQPKSPQKPPVKQKATQTSKPEIPTSSTLIKESQLCSKCTRNGQSLLKAQEKLKIAEKKAEKFESQSNKYDELEKKMRKMKKEMEELKKENEKVKEESEGLKEELKRKTEEIEDLEKKNKDLENEVLSEQQKNINYQKEKTVMNQKMEGIQLKFALEKSQLEHALKRKQMTLQQLNSMGSGPSMSSRSSFSTLSISSSSDNSGISIFSRGASFSPDSNSPSTSPATSSEPSTSSQVSPNSDTGFDQKLVCYICYDQFQEGQKLAICKGCNNHTHQECGKDWSKAQKELKVKDEACGFCRRRMEVEKQKNKKK